MEPAKTAREIARSCRKAFRNGDLNDIAALKNALAWKNYLESDGRRSAVEAFLKLDYTALNALPGKAARPESAYLCCGRACSTPGQMAYWVAITDKKFEQAIPSIPADLWSRHPIRRQVVAQAKVWLQRKEREILWLSDLGHHELPGLNAGELVADLGQLGVTGGADRRVIVFTVSVSGDLSKPTLADAGYTYYWRASPSSRDYGMTRSLRDNRPAYKEWVAPKSVVEIVDAWPLRLEDFSLDESRLRMAFWQACREEMRQTRMAMGLTP